MALRAFEWTEANVPSGVHLRGVNVLGSGFVGALPTSDLLWFEAEANAVVTQSTSVLTADGVWSPFSVSFEVGTSGTVTYRFWIDESLAGGTIYVEPTLYNHTLILPASDDVPSVLAADFGSWTETGTRMSSAMIVVDDAYAANLVVADIVFDRLTNLNSETGATLSAASLELANHGGGVYELRMLTGPNGAIFRGHISGFPTQDFEGIFKPYPAEDITAVLAAIAAGGGGGSAVAPVVITTEG